MTMTDVDLDAQQEAADAGRQEPAFTPAEIFYEFEGKPVVGIITKINGTSSRITRSIHIKERVVILGILEGSGVAHGQTKEGQKRTQTLATDNLYEVPEDLAQKWEAELRQRLIDDGHLLDEQLTIHDAAEVVIDGSGVAMTPAEQAEATGVPSLPEPWDGYDRLTTTEVRREVKEMTTIVAVDVIEAYEKATSNRGTVLKACVDRRAELEAADR